MQKSFFSLRQKKENPHKKSFCHSNFTKSLFVKILEKIAYFETGFTLIELLVTIAILAVLATVTVVVINPGELLKQSRDATRLEDLALIKRAIGLYLADGTPLPFTTSVYRVSSQSSIDSNIDGTGWVPLDFTLLSFGSPISRLPLDPQNIDNCSLSGIINTITGSLTVYNSCHYNFSFVMSPTAVDTIILSAALESQKYRQQYSGIGNGTGISIYFPVK